MTDHDVTFEWPDGRRETVAVGPRETVLDAALRERIRLPSDCRKGTCTACVGRLLAVDERDSDADEMGGTNDENGARETEEAAGTDETDETTENRSIDAARAFDYRRQPEALSASERSEGYVLLCIAMARADCRVAVGPMVRAEVGDSPWA